MIAYIAVTHDSTRPTTWSQEVAPLGFTIFIYSLCSTLKSKIRPSHPTLRSELDKVSEKGIKLCGHEMYSQKPFAADYIRRQQTTGGSACIAEPIPVVCFEEPEGVSEVSRTSRKETCLDIALIWVCSQGLDQGIGHCACQN